MADEGEWAVVVETTFGGCTAPDAEDEEDEEDEDEDGKAPFHFEGDKSSTSNQSSESSPESEDEVDDAEPKAAFEYVST